MTCSPSIRTLVAMTSPSAPVIPTTDPAGYALGRSDAEADRLQLQHLIYGGATRALLVAAGIEPGIRVLDVGSGGGDVALLLADLVGPAGEVVGVEVAPETIALAERTRSRRPVWATCASSRPTSATCTSTSCRSTPSSAAGC